MKIMTEDFILKSQIPLNPPLLKGDFKNPPLKKGGRGDLLLL
jgi:hypothetical protein